MFTVACMPLPGGRGHVRGRGLRSHSAPARLPLANYHTGISTLQTQLGLLAVPRRLHRVPALVSGAIQQQSGYFQDWAQRITAGEHFSFSAADDRVAAAHRDLVTAHKLLMQL